MDSGNTSAAAADSQAWFYWPPLWVALSATAIGFMTGLMVWQAQ